MALSQSQGLRISLQIDGIDGGHLCLDWFGPDRAELHVLGKDGREFSTTMSDAELMRVARETSDALKCLELLHEARQAA